MSEHDNEPHGIHGQGQGRKRILHGLIRAVYEAPSPGDELLKVITIANTEDPEYDPGSRPVGKVEKTG